jgi:general secretion pathway protein D
MKTRYAFCTSVLCFWLILNASVAFGARVTGEDGVTPTSPAPEKKEKVDIRRPQPARRPPVRIESREPEIAPPPSPPSDAASSDKRYVTIDFDNVEMAVFIKFISELTGKNFVVDKAVTGNVTVVSPTKISVDEAYRVFESVLEVYGFAAVPAGHITKIVPAAEAKSRNIETRLKEQAVSPEDKIITQLVPLRYADPNELKTLFAPLISKNSLMVPYTPTGTLIVTDVQSNIKRLLQIINTIDVEGVGEQISVVPLEYATATVLEKSLNTLFQQTAVRARVAGKAEGMVRVASDERTNSLILMASKDDTQRLKQLIKILDTQMPQGEGDIHVYYLQNGNAEDMAAVLKAIPTDQQGAQQAAKTPVISKDVQIVADKATNSLVITANKSDYLVLEDVIRKLDISRRMVYIEALLMEVSVNKNFSVGVEWLVGKDDVGFDGKEAGVFAGSTSTTSIIPSGEGATLPVGGLAMGILGESIKIGDVTFPSIAAVVKAYEGDSDIHILSTPQIMTLDNEEAEIIVADNIPFLTRQEDTSGVVTGVNYNQYEFKDVGVTLNITPQINQERFVRLKILQEVSQVKDAETLGLPTTLKRQTKTTVSIKDGHTVVIGGLIDETLNKGETQTPCLGDIPGLGWLFKSTSNSGDKTNLYIFITPHIVENPDEARKVYEEKRDDIEGVKEGIIKMYKTPWSNGEPAGQGDN